MSMINRILFAAALCLAAAGLSGQVRTIDKAERDQIACVAENREYYRQYLRERERIKDSVRLELDLPPRELDLVWPSVVRQLEVDHVFRPAALRLWVYRKRQCKTDGRDAG